MFLLDNLHLWLNPFFWPLLVFHLAKHIVMLLNYNYRFLFNFGRKFRKHGDIGEFWRTYIWLKTACSSTLKYSFSDDEDDMLGMMGKIGIPDITNSLHFLREQERWENTTESTNGWTSLNDAYIIARIESHTSDLWFNTELSTKVFKHMN